MRIFTIVSVHFSLVWHWPLWKRIPRSDLCFYCRLYPYLVGGINARCIHVVLRECTEMVLCHFFLHVKIFHLHKPVEIHYKVFKDLIITEMYVIMQDV